MKVTLVGVKNIEAFETNDGSLVMLIVIQIQPQLRRCSSVIVIQVMFLLRTTG